MSTPGSQLWCMSTVVKYKMTFPRSNVECREFYGLTSSWRLWPSQEWIYSWVYIGWVVGYGDLGYGVMLNWMSLWGIPWGSIVCSQSISSLGSSFHLCYSCFDDYDSSALPHAPYHDDLIFLTTAQEAVDSSVRRLKPRKSSTNIKLPVSWYSQTFVIETERH